MQAQFRWVSDASGIPARWDLRLLGWERVDDAGAPCLFDARRFSHRGNWNRLPRPELTLAVGVTNSEERTAMLAAGLGEALPLQSALGEISIRLLRLSFIAGALPRQRRIGPLLLDLLYRDARCSERWLALHPREFALMWRLADTPGKRVSRDRLIRDVWRLAHVPATNSLEVHISRLRAKLAVVRAAWMVETDPLGGYRLACIDSAARWTAPAPLPTLADIS